MQSFRNLRVWQKAHNLTLHVYLASREFPREEVYGLTSQMRRASASIGANIAEGCCRSGDAEMGRYLQIPLGSASELEYHFVLARDLGLLKLEEYERLAAAVVEVKRMLASLIRKVRAASRGPTAES